MLLSPFFRQRAVGYACSCTKRKIRSYSSHVTRQVRTFTQASISRHGGDLYAATLLCSGGSSASPQHFLDALEPLPGALAPGPKLVTILASPRFHTWVTDPNIFIAKALSLLNIFRGHIDPVSKVNVLAAVVDGVVQAPQGASTSANPTDSTEGISILVSAHTDQNDLSDLKSTSSQQSLKRREIGDLGGAQRHCLSVTLPTASDRECAIEIPLANTLFRNGMDYTITASEWLYSVRPFGFLPTEQNLLSRAMIKIPSRRDSDFIHSISTPLAPLTQPHRIATGMGNVIRELFENDECTQRIPASQELELEVSRFFKIKNIEPQLLETWALIFPSEIFRTASDMSDRERALRYGARLHRVLSGGGGWGTREGLLALDPEMRISKLEPVAKDSEEQLDAAVFDMERRNAIGQVARPGDFVQFFALDSSSLLSSIEKLEIDDGQYQNTERPLDLSSTPQLKVLFGVQLPHNESTSQEGLDSSGKDDIKIACIPHCFSVTSEQGLAQTIRLTHEGSPASGASNIAQTKIDAPGSSITFKTAGCNHQVLRQAHQMSR